MLETVTDPEGGTEYAWNYEGAPVQVINEAGARGLPDTSRGQMAMEVLKDWTGSPTAPQPAADVVRGLRDDNNGRLSSPQTDATGRTTRYTHSPMT